MSDPKWLTDFDKEVAEAQAKEEAAIRSDERRRKAEEIRRELVCCDVYERYQDRGLPEYMAYHAICFWAEAAARLVEEAPNDADDD